MKITSIETFPIRVPRPVEETTGTAGLPTGLTDTAWDYRWSEVYPALYALHFETAVVKVVADNGLTGWGEAQAPLAPQVACTIIDCLLKPVLLRADFSGEVEAIQSLWWQMYSAMRVRGQTGGFMLDAISGVDLALWDLAGRARGVPVSRLITENCSETQVPAYISGLAGHEVEQRVEAASGYWSQGFRTFKLFYDSGREELLGLFDALRAKLGDDASIAVDALWRLDPEDGLAFGRALDERRALWLECPFPPEDCAAHADLSRRIRTPLALGESYRTHYELEPFFQQGAVGILQPDLGRCGITESIRLARRAAEHNLCVVPHISVAAGPQLAAGIHFAAATENCSLAEYNPKVLEIANRFLERPLGAGQGHYAVPTGPGLGIEVNEDALREARLRSGMSAGS